MWIRSHSPVENPPRTPKGFRIKSKILTLTDWTSSPILASSSSLHSPLLRCTPASLPSFWPQVGQLVPYTGPFHWPYFTVQNNHHLCLLFLLLFHPLLPLPPFLCPLPPFFSSSSCTWMATSSSRISAPIGPLITQPKIPTCSSSASFYIALFFLFSSLFLVCLL